MIPVDVLKRVAAAFSPSYWTSPQDYGIFEIAPKDLVSGTMAGAAIQAAAGYRSLAASE